MTELQLVPFKAAHLLAFQDRDGWAPKDWKLALTHEREGVAFTMLVDGRPLGCAGMGRLEGTETWKAWVSITDAAFAYRIWVTRTVRRMLRDTARALEIDRIEADALLASPRNQCWLESLGFERDDAQLEPVVDQGVVLLRYVRDMRPRA